MTLALAPDRTDAARRLVAAGRLIGATLPHVPFDPAVGLDGSATGTRGGRFLAGCSVPRRAAERMIRKENWPGRALALVTPTHAQQIAAVMDRLGPTKALVVLTARPDDVADLLAVLDFTEHLTDGRLHFAWDDASLRAAYARRPGVAVPQQMARLPDADADAAAAVIGWAKSTLAALVATPTPPPSIAHGPARRVLAARQFRLWDNAGDTLARTLVDAAPAGVAACAFDTDRPDHATVAGAAGFTHGASVVVAADCVRPAWLDAATAWACWVTTPAVPSFDAAHRRDAVLLADAAWRPLATNAGWPPRRIVVAGWPAETVASTPAALPAVLLNAPDLTTPADLKDVTARRLVWEAIREELTLRPFAVGDDTLAYVRRAPARLGLPADVDFPAERYVRTLVGPAYAVGMTRWLAGEGVAYTLCGNGWDDSVPAGGMSCTTSAAARAVDSSTADTRCTTRSAARAAASVARCSPPVSRAAVRDALAASCGLIDLSLPHTSPAASAVGVPVVRTFGRTAARVLHDVAALAAGRLSVPPPVLPSLSWAVVDAATAA